MDYLKRVIADLTMYPMSLYESGESTGNISLEALFDNPRTNMGAPLNGEIFHYRDRYGLEADIVLHMEDGRYALIECKLGSAEYKTVPDISKNWWASFVNTTKKRNKLPSVSLISL